MASLQLDNVNIKALVDNNIVTIVNDVNISCSDNMDIAIIGESGCGKSMLASALFDLLPSNCTLDGSILFNGEDVTKNIASIRGRSFSLVPQGALEHLNNNKTIYKQMLDECKKYKLTKTESDLKIKEALSLVNLDYDDVLNKYPFELSGGMGQRVIFAIALLSNASVVVFDEATNGLDDDVKLNIMKLYKKSFKDKLTLFITHDLSLLDYFDKIVVMCHGRILEVANSPLEFKHPYSIALRDSSSSYLLKPIEKLDDNTSSFCSFYQYCNKRSKVCLEKKIEYKDEVYCHNAQCC